MTKTKRPKDARLELVQSMGRATLVVVSDGQGVAAVDLHCEDLPTLLEAVTILSRRALARAERGGK